MACAALFPAPAQARSLIKLDTIQRDGYGVVELKRPLANELFMEASLNGHPIRLILDTGAASHQILLSNPTSRLLRVPPHLIKGTSFAVSGKAIGSISQGTADSFAIGNVQVSGTTLYFATLKSLQNRDIEGLYYTDGTLGNAHRVNRDADGFLGMAFLQKCAAIIDLPNARLYLKPPGTGRTANLEPALRELGYHSATFDQTNDGLIVNVSINGVAGKMIVDTGSYLTVIDSRFAAQAKFKSYRVGGGEFTDVAGARVETEMGEPDSFKVGGVEVLRAKMVVAPTGFYKDTGGKLVGLLGMDFLGQSWGIIDFAAHKVYFVPVK
ncbi:MAG: aspartyl protease family protein [Chthoniobacterales bacterium]